MRISCGFKVFFWVLIFHNLCIAHVCAQEYDAAYLGLDKFKSLTAAHGLPSNNVTGICLDENGFLWAGTNNGLVRYDGSIVKVFKAEPNDPTKLPGNEISRLGLDADGNVWVGTYANGVCKYDAATGQFKRYNIFLTSEQLGQTGERITRIKNLPNGLWVSVEGYGVARYDPDSDRFETFLVPPHDDTFKNRQRRIIGDFLQDPHNEDKVWMPSYDGLWTMDISTEEWTMYDDIPGESSPVPERLSFRKSAVGPDGKFYITVFRRGVFVFDPEALSWEAIHEKTFNPLHLRENNYQGVLPRDSSSMWLYSNTRGIGILDFQQEVIHTLGNCNGGEGIGDLCSLQANDMLVDKDGNIIIATREGLRIYPSTDRLFKKITIPIRADHLKGRFNVGTIFPLDSLYVLAGGYAGEGLYLANRNTGDVRLIEPPKGFRVGELREMCWISDIKPYRQNEILVVGAFFIYIYHTDSQTLTLAPSDLNQAEHKGHFSVIHHHSDGYYYLATRHNGVYVLDTNLQVVDNLVHDPKNPNSLASSSYVHDFATDPSGRLVIASEKGITLYDPATKTFENSDRETRKDSIPTLRVIYQPRVNPIDSSLWILDNRYGIGRLAWPYDLSLGSVEILDEKVGLLHTKCHNIYQFNKSEMFVTTSGGLTWFSEGKYKSAYPTTLGFPVTAAFSPLVATPDSTFWVGYRNVITAFNPFEIEEKDELREMYISSIQIFQNELNDEAVYRDLKEVSLTYLQNFFTIQVGVVDVFNREAYTVSYRLKGFEDEWVVAGSDYKAVFTNVPGGQYTFEARVVNHHDREMGNRISLPLRIIPPFWKTPWFILLCVLFLAVVIGIIYVVQIRSVRREERLRSEFAKRLAETELAALRAQINPHFLFNSINGIRHEIMLGRMHEAETYLVKFSTLVRMILENTGYQIIPLQQELKALQLYIDLESLRFDNQFSFCLELNPEIDPERTFIPPMLIQPFVENAIWHGLRQKEGEGTVEILIEQSDDKLFVTITDNGIGREKAREIKSKSTLKKRSLGMEITGNRLEIIEKIYNIRCSAEVSDLRTDSGEAAGTQILLTLPLLKDHEDLHT